MEKDYENESEIVEKTDNSTNSTPSRRSNRKTRKKKKKSLSTNLDYPYSRVRRVFKIFAVLSMIGGPMLSLLYYSIQIGVDTPVEEIDQIEATVFALLTIIGIVNFGLGSWMLWMAYKWPNEKLSGRTTMYGWFIVPTMLLGAFMTTIAFIYGWRKLRHL